MSTSAYHGHDHQLAQLRAEIATLRVERDHYRRLTMRDPSTRLYSRAHFDVRLTHEWARARQTWTPLSLLYVELDGARDIADRAGTALLDQALTGAGILLLESCREIDIPCRLGPSSFGIILPATNRTAGEAELRRLGRRLNDPCSILPSDVQLRYSLGMAVALSEADSPLDLLVSATADCLEDRGAYEPVSSRSTMIIPAPRESGVHSTIPAACTSEAAALELAC